MTLFVVAKPPLEYPQITDGMGVVEFVGVADDAPGVVEVAVRAGHRGPIGQVVLNWPCTAVLVRVSGYTWLASE